MLNKEIQLAVDKGQMLPLMEEFYTIQGEGFHTGTAAYFIRIGGWSLRSRRASASTIALSDSSSVGRGLAHSVRITGPVWSSFTATASAPQPPSQGANVRYSICKLLFFGRIYVTLWVSLLFQLRGRTGRSQETLSFVGLVCLIP